MHGKRTSKILTYMYRKETMIIYYILFQKHIVRFFKRPTACYNTGQSTQLEKFMATNKELSEWTKYGTYTVIVNTI